jgi:hypothetical protein
MKSVFTVVLLLVGPLYAGEILRIEGSAFGEFFDLAHAPGAEMVVTDEGLQGAGGGVLHSSIINITTPANFVRAEWDIEGASVEVVLLTEPQNTDAAPIFFECFRYFLSNGQEVTQARYESTPGSRRGDTVPFICLGDGRPKATFAESGEGAAVASDYAHMQLKVLLSASEPFVLRSLVLYDDAAPTAVEAASWGAVKGHE